MPPVMIDASINPQAALSSARAAGYDVQATCLYTDDGGAGAHIATAADVATLHGQGLPVLAIFNGAWVNGSTPGTEAQGTTDATNAVREAQALGLPKGCGLGYDIEYDADGRLQGIYLVAAAKVILAADYIPVFYVDAEDPRFNPIIDDALAADYATMAQCVFWLASWLGTGDPVAAVPDWSNAKGPNGLPWQQVHRDQCGGWQWWGGASADAFDLSIIRPPLTALLWAPATQPQPQPQPTPTPSGDVAALQAQIASLQQQVSTLQARIAAAKQALG